MMGEIENALCRSGTYSAYIQHDHTHLLDINLQGKRVRKTTRPHAHHACMGALCMPPLCCLQLHPQKYIALPLATKALETR
jgi:hypothetical protein